MGARVEGAWATPKKVTRLELGSANEEKDLSPAGRGVFLYRKKARLGQQFDKVVACESR